MTAPAAAQVAELADAPKPIPAPPVPGPATLAAAPPVTLGSPVRPVRNLLTIPPPPTVTPVAFPAVPILTQADKADPAPAPKSGAQTGAPARTSPGAQSSGIESTAFLVDPGATQPTGAAEAKLRHIAETMKANPGARIEIRAYAPVKSKNEGDARRVALARCVAIRDALTASGVPDDHIDFRALTSEPTEADADRIELYVER